MVTRGTPQNPGLCLALNEDDQSMCIGMALRVPEHDRIQVLAETRAREVFIVDFFPFPFDDIY